MTKITDKNYHHYKTQVALADALYDDLPDEAYWAACEELGVGSDVQVALYEYEKANGLESDMEEM